MPSVAIIGSGPAGCYMTDALAKAIPQARIDIFERLPFPFGLVRYGVAADHQGTKNISGVFARFMKRPGVNFLGGIDVGRDVSLSALQSRYDAVVIASGAASGSKADIPGADLPTSLAALDVVRWFNGHPDLAEFTTPTRPSSVCIIGNGNVSLDVARLLAKTADERKGTDLYPPASSWLDGLQLEQITICGRRSAGDTRFSSVELNEIGALSAFGPVVEPRDVGSSGENPEALEILRRFSESSPGARRPIRFLFDVEMSSYRNGHLWVRKRGGETTSVAADLLIHAVGQRSSALAGLPFDAARGVIPSVGGLVMGTENTYVVGWAARAGIGTIASNRTDAQTVASLLASRLKARGTGMENAPFGSLLPSGRSPVTWQDWLRLDAVEIETGRRHGCIRRKLVSWTEVDAALVQSRMAG